MNEKKKMSLRVVIVLLTGMVAACPGQTENMGDIELKLKKKAEELARKYMIIDTHLDVPYRLKKKMEDISETTAGGDFDYPRARKGGLDGGISIIRGPGRGGLMWPLWPSTFPLNTREQGRLTRLPMKQLT